jgi:sugar phosphate isomerase/epimerase
VKLAMSNLAWAPEERLGAYAHMQAAGLTGLEIAPGLFFERAADPLLPDNVMSSVALTEIGSHKLSLVSMQSLLFGVSGAALFGSEAEQAAFENGMNRAIGLAGRFQIPNLVFGSPSQRRIPKGMSSEEAAAHATEVFRRLGQRAALVGTVISLEANPAQYGTNFLNTIDEAEKFVARVAHPAVGLVLDLGETHVNGSFATLVGRIAALAPRLNHVHVSEPHLAPAPDDRTTLTPVLAALKSAGYQRFVSIEMKRSEGGLETVRRRIAALVAASEGKLK